MAIEIIKQDGVEYKVEDGVIKGCVGTSPFKKHIFDNGVIIEGWDQADTDAENLYIEKQTAISSFKLRKEKAEQIIDDTFQWMEEKLLASSGAISQTTYDTTIDTVETVLAPLKNGRLIKVKDDLEKINNLSGLKEELRLYVIGLINTALGI